MSPSKTSAAWLTRDMEGGVTLRTSRTLRTLAHHCAPCAP